MATKYRISESGVQKIVEILDGDTVVGIRKFSPKEISVSYVGNTVQIKDNFTGNTLFEGPSANFVKSDNSTFAETAGDAVSAMTNLANNIKIDVRELDGLTYVNDAIAPDLSNYATTDQVAAQISPLSDVVATKIEQHIEHTDVSEIWTLVPDSVKSTRSMSITFTVPSNGKVRIDIPIQIEMQQAGTIYGFLNTADPGEDGQYYEQGDDELAHNDFMDNYFDSVGGVQYGERLTCVRFPSSNADLFPYTTASLVSEKILNLTPGDELTLYLWVFTGAVQFAMSTDLNFVNGIKVFEVVD